MGTEAALPRGVRVIDAYISALEEFFFITHPTLRKGTDEGELKLAIYLQSAELPPPQYVWYVHAGVAVKTLPESEYTLVRTARNRHIITDEAQARYRAIRVGIAGLSVGSSAVMALARTGGPRFLKIADFDTLELSNLNRIQLGLQGIGEAKALLVAREVWDIDPYAEIEIFEHGVDATNVERFIGEPPLHVLIEETDGLPGKILMRKVARRRRVPVLMATDMGDSVLIDVERYDLDGALPLFHGAVSEDELNEVAGAKVPDKRAWARVATKLLGPERTTPAMRRSLMEIGSTIQAVPQLGSSAMLAGAALSFCVRRIATDEALPSGRYSLSLEEVLVPGWNDAAERKKREEESRRFSDSFINGV